MMNKIFITVFMVLISAAVCAQGCFNFRVGEGDKCLAQRRYSEAKAWYEKAKNCEDKPANFTYILGEKIRQCDEKIAPGGGTATAPGSGGGGKKGAKQQPPQDSVVVMKFEVSPMYKEYSAGGGESIVKITSSWPWEVEGGAPWIKYSKLSDEVLSISCEANEVPRSRADSLRIVAEGQLAVVRITQKEGVSVLAVSLDECPFDRDGETMLVKVDANSPEWEVTEWPEWINIEKFYNTFTVKCGYNTTDERRAGYIKVRLGDKEKVIVVNQAGAPKTLRDVLFGTSLKKKK